MSSLSPITCRACRKGTMQPVERTETFNPPTGEVKVQTLAARCTECGTEKVLPSQMAQNIALRRARQAAYGPHMLGEDIFAFRRKWGLTQPDAAKIFGKGKIAFCRYENEATFPDDSTRLLIQVAMQRPEVLKDLADKAGVEIPLYDQRCEDEHARKRRELHVVRSETVTLDLETPEEPPVPMAAFA